jgi:DNA-directed RNA polymerase specialized sigma24 family protein
LIRWAEDDTGHWHKADFQLPKLALEALAAVLDYWWGALRDRGAAGCLLPRHAEHAFLCGVALRVASNAHRAVRSVPPLDSEVLDTLRDSGPSPEQVAEDRQARALLDLALDQLPLELRTALVFDRPLP